MSALPGKNNRAREMVFCHSVFQGFYQKIENYLWRTCFPYELRY